MQLHYGVVEDRNDPEMMGRVKVRVAGVHTQNKQEIPTEDLPWSMVMTPTTSPSISGVGVTPYMVEGTWVVCTFIDDYMQDLLIMGTLPGKSMEYRSGSVGFSSPIGNYPRTTDQVDLPAASRPTDAANHPTIIARDNELVEDVIQAIPPRMPTVSPDDVGQEPHERPTMSEQDALSARKNDHYPLTYSEEYEGGHLVEYSNTPGEERHSYSHPTGTYYEINGAGDYTTKVVGDHNEWNKKDKNIFIKGDCNITVYGSMKHYVKGDYTLEVEGNYHQTIGKSLRQKIGSNHESEIGQDFSQTIGSNYSQQIKQNRTITVTAGNDTLTVAAGSQMLTVGTDVTQTVNGKRTETTIGNKAEITVGSASYFGKPSITVESGSHVITKSGGDQVMTAATIGSWNCGGAVDITGSTIDLN